MVSHTLSTKETTELLNEFEEEIMFEATKSEETPNVERILTKVSDGEYITKNGAYILEGTFRGAIKVYPNPAYFSDPYGGANNSYVFLSEDILKEITAIQALVAMKQETDAKDFKLSKAERNLKEILNKKED